MKKFILILFCCSLLFCCKSQYNFQLPENTTEKIIYKPETNSKGFVLNIPKNYVVFFEVAKSYSYNFIYKKNMILYISEEFSSNEDYKRTFEKESFEDVYNRIILAEYGSISNCDTLILEGVTNSLYWKEIFIYWKENPYLNEETITDSLGCVIRKLEINPNPFKKLYFGYINVPKKYKESFDNSLNSLRPLEDTTIKRDSIILEYLENERKVRLQ